MYCINCGKNIGDVENDLCQECDATLNTTKLEDDNVEVIKEVNNKYSNNNNNANQYNNNAQSKSKIAAGLFGIFLGGLGIHNFYLGYTNKAIAQLLLSFVSCGMLAWASSVWGLIEGILIISGEISKDAQGNPLI